MHIRAGLMAAALAAAVASTVPATAPWSQIAYAAQSCDVRHVAVDGEVRVRDGELLTLDVEKVRSAAEKSAARLFK